MFNKCNLLAGLGVVLVALGTVANLTLRVPLGPDILRSSFVEETNLDFLPFLRDEVGRDAAIVLVSLDVPALVEYEVVCFILEINLNIILTKFI